jgi:SAM-dependent methyltransferase
VAIADWDPGSYERIAEQLLPAAFAAVSAAGPEPGEMVLDIGCGTGNAALLASQRGAEVLGVDPAPRLIEVARRQAAERGLDALFEVADAEHLPVPDGSAHLVLSVFGVIFAPDAAAAAAEMSRACAAEGRIVLTAWIPDEVISKVARARAQAVAGALGASGGAPYPWHEPAAVEALLGPRGFTVEAREKHLEFTASSPQAFLEDELRDHPLWIAAREALEPRGGMGVLLTQALETLEAGNEDPDAFRVTSRYALVIARREELP